MSSDKHEKWVLLKDRLARYLIEMGGWAVIFSVVAIMFFIFIEVLPLFYSPESNESARWVVSQRLSHATGMAVGTDEYRETAFRLNDQGVFEFLELEEGAPLGSVPLPALGGKKITAAARALKRPWVAFGTADGMVGSAEVRYSADYKGAQREMVYEVRGGEQLYKIDPAGGRIKSLAGVQDEDGGTAIAALKADGRAAYLSVNGDGDSVISPIETDASRVTVLAMKRQGGQLVAGAGDGMVYVFDIEDGRPLFVERFKAAGAAITALGFLNGDEALVIGDEAGHVSEWFSVRHLLAKNNGAAPVTLDAEYGITLKPGEEREVIDRNYAGKRGVSAELSFTTVGMRYLDVRSFASHASPVRLIAPSPRDKGFITAAADGALAYHYSTTGRSYPGPRLEKEPALVALSPKSNGFVALDKEGVLYDFAFTAHHPDVTFETLFQKVWYEGYTGPERVWQSSGGTDDFEAKFSLWPLIFGTLKGTVYAMLFSVPIAVLGAIYLSQLAPAALRNVVKPAIELMAAIPSVVVGFLAGLWLSPLMDRHLMQVFLLILAIPAAWLIFVMAIWAMPWHKRPDISGRFELLYLLPVLLAGIAVGVGLAPAVENGLFGGDIKTWLNQTLAIIYDPRNCLVVGFALGFAVIPIIFTISEDALSAVPGSLTSASFALAASRWQTAIHVVLPAASPGIFAAIMLGFGRAVGETMIVLMATGNTPITDWSIFNGMRAMSAAIAVEMPEAPVGGSLYRVLFLIGFLLFVFTFLINTLAGFISNRLRRKYSRF